MNPLQAIYHSYSALQAARQVALRCAVGASNPIFHGTSLDGMSSSDIQDELQKAKSELDDLTILSLYAAFEAAIREYSRAQAEGLPVSLGLTTGFQTDLFKNALVGWCGRLKLDEVRKLFHPIVGDDLASRVGQIEKYRHWVAHGRRGGKPTSADPTDTFADLTLFLQVAGII